ncbi:MAG: protein kinase [Kofleriaceae bacterium]
MVLAAPTQAHAFGKYTLVAKLATGGMAEIFLARLQGAAGFEKLVCVKRILPHLAKDQQLVNMFLSEAKIAAQISHGNVCSVYELGEIDGRYFIAMEYLEGVPFACFRRPDMYSGTIDPRLVAGLGIQACQGLHHAHQLKKPDGTLLEVVHRDVSANNLFITVDGNVKVLDFGIAKVQDASVRTSTGSVKGTYAYMAPEQLRGEKLDRRTDVFALGTVLWELFARRHCFKRETDFLTFQAITTDPIPDIAEFRPDVPPALGEVIAKALSRNRDDRFPTARAMGEALAKAVAAIGGPMSAAEISDEVMAAFDARLSKQRELVRVAREGGALPLDEDLGPAVGHGTLMATTPVSMLSNRGEVDATTPSAPPIVSPPPAPAPAPVLPPAPSTNRAAIIGVVAFVLVAAGVAAALLLRNDTETKVAVAVDAAVVASAPVDAATIDAAMVETAVIDAAAIDAAVIDAAVVEVAPDAAVKTVAKTEHKRADKKPPPVRASGPPGTITIDSVPVYAVISIDGKKMGETPLVKLSLAPGKHTVRAVSASGSTKTYSITIESGKQAPALRIQW